MTKWIIQPGVDARYIDGIVEGDYIIPEVHLGGCLIDLLLNRYSSEVDYAAHTTNSVMNRVRRVVDKNHLPAFFRTNSPFGVIRIGDMNHYCIPSGRYVNLSRRNSEHLLFSRELADLTRGLPSLELPDWIRKEDPDRQMDEDYPDYLPIYGKRFYYYGNRRWK